MFEEEYEDESLIPSQVRHFYKKDGEKWVLISAGEVKSVDDVRRVQEGLRKEREDHKVTKQKLAAYGNLDMEEVQAKLDRYDELEAAAAGKIDDAKINEMVESRIRTKTAPIERQLTVLQNENNELKTANENFKAKEVRRVIHDQVRSAAATLKIRDTAMPDVELLAERVFEVVDNAVVTKDGVGVTPGIDPTVWLGEIKQTRPHWWNESQGMGAKGGSGGGTGVNPFSREHWNLTEQSRLVNENRTRAEQLARSAGTSIGGGMPPKK